ncbi:two-component system sensor histidine kinase YesM [Fontibacillus solani]|uniref:histidine kinase n=1 Tax=Fontibacillus solani TaxID=1572857 RepID=A0A7W3XSV2_9BACL|nr:sensor histidine kinase [Fontibacillus solani]MBA9087107.1 two-component system sensor histidine kinase YesM [Fontibacillus solani]
MKQRIRLWFGGLSFKSKLLTVFIPLVLVPLCILAFLSSRIFSSSLIERSVNDVINESGLIINKFESIKKNMEICSNMLVTDLNRLYENFPIQRNEVEENRFRASMQSRLTTNLSLFGEVDAAVFIDNNGKIYTSYVSGKNESATIRSGLPRRLLEQGNYGTAYWFPMEKRGSMTPDPDVPVLTLGKVVININSGEKYGTLYLIVKEPTLSAFLGSPDQSGQKNYFLVDERQMIVASSDKQRILRPVTDSAELGLLGEAAGKNETMTRNVNGKRLITVSNFPGMNWKLFTVVDVAILTKDIGKNIRLIILTGFCCLALSVIGANFLSKAVLHPLQELTKAMRRVMDGNLQVQSPVQTQDELGLISRVFNTMIQRIQELMRTMGAEQLRKREYELALITSQVKPHFLYNTLDTIYILNDMERNLEARNTTKALADFYRAVLSKGRELIILEQEIKMTTDYLAIMQIRYPDILRYEVYIPEELRSAPIPKLSLQPLVENAIYHGLKTKGEPGIIRISAREDQNKTIIRVEDDGIGMSEERLKEAAYRSGDGQIQSIGIYSVQERIRLYFGPQYGITILSEEGKGTRVELTIPMIKDRRSETDVQGNDRG